MSGPTPESVKALLDGTTPEHWQVDGPFYWTGGHDDDADSTAVITSWPDRHAVAVMPCRGDRTERADADAALIAAAPDLARAYLTQHQALTNMVHNYRLLLQAHAQVVMDTPEDRELHALVIDTFTQVLTTGDPA